MALASDSLSPHDMRQKSCSSPIFETVASCPMSTSFSSMRMYGYVSERDSSSRISASQTTFDFEPPAVARATAVLRDRLRRDHTRGVLADVDALAARVLMLALAGKRDRQHFAVRAFAGQPDCRVLHRQL